MLRSWHVFHHNKGNETFVFFLFPPFLLSRLNGKWYRLPILNSNSNLCGRFPFWMEKRTEQRWFCVFWSLKTFLWVHTKKINGMHEWHRSRRNCPKLSVSNVTEAGQTWLADCISLTVVDFCMETFLMRSWQLKETNNQVCRWSLYYLRSCDRSGSAGKWWFECCVHINSRAVFLRKRTNESILNCGWALNHLTDLIRESNFLLICCKLDLFLSVHTAWMVCLKKVTDLRWKQGNGVQRLLGLETGHP